MSVLVPFELWQDTAIVLRLSVNGVVATALLDTGATLSLIDRGFHDALNVPATGKTYNVQTPTGATQAQGVEAIQLSIDGVPLCSTRAARYDLSPLTEAHGAPVELLLGRDFFETFVIEVDFVVRQLRLTPPQGFDARSLPAPLPLARGSRSERAIPISMEKHDTVLAILDLGSSTPVMLSVAYAAKANLVRDKPTSTAATAMMTGISISTTFSLDELTIGSVVFSHVPAEAFPQWRSSEFQVSVGLPVFAQCRPILDFAGNRIWLLDDGRRQGFAKDRSGLGLAFDKNALIVKHVARRGPAEQAGGWSEGDRIVRIDGHELGPNYRSSPLAQWRQSAIGTQFALTMDDGSVRHLTLRDYY